MPHREFVNEFGNRIVITVTGGVPDPDAVCVACRWRGGHKPGCAVEGWPEMPHEDDRILLRIEGPTSVSENYLTPMEAAQLFAAYVESIQPKVDASGCPGEGKCHGPVK